jgi:hypothetical protein
VRYLPDGALGHLLGSLLPMTLQDPLSAAAGGGDGGCDSDSDDGDDCDVGVAACEEKGAREMEETAKEELLVRVGGGLGKGWGARREKDRRVMAVDLLLVLAAQNRDRPQV